MYEFTTDKIDLVIEDSENGFYYGKTSLKWGVEFEMRSWGVKGSMIFIPDQKLCLSYEKDDKNGESELVEEVKEFSSEMFEVDKDYVKDLLCPQSIEINKNGKVKVMFT